MNTDYRYLTSTCPVGSQHLYSVRYSNTSSVSTCLTCTLHSSLPPCLYSDTLLSPHYSAYLLACQGPAPPYTVLVTLPANTVHTIIHRNNHINIMDKERDMPVTQDISIKKDFGKTSGQIRIKLVKPKNIKEGDHIPVVLMMAETPGAQQVNQRWSCGLECYLVSSSNMVVAMVDVRGSTGQGHMWEQSIRGKLGVLETQDMEEVVKYLQGLDYIDQSKIGVYGKGYGGFLALNTMLSNLPVLNNIRCGLVIAPITQWLHTSSFVVERLMGMPDMVENLVNYEKASLVGREDLASLRSKEIMLIHGMLDRQVLVENTMMLTKKLVQENILFQQQVCAVEYIQSSQKLTGT